MANSETGHAKNVANFEDMISFVTGYGATYNPSKASIKLLALNTQLGAAKGSLVALNTATTPYQNATNTREIVFAPLNKLVTRVVNALDATDASAQVVADAKTLARKIQGKRATPKKEGTDEKSISASQTSFDSKIENFSKLIILLQAEPLYKPNEFDLKTAYLSEILQNMTNKNKAVIDATAPLSNARINRNKVLYAPSTGVYDIQNEIKKYVKSVYGSTSPEYKQISKIKFTKPR